MCGLWGGISTSLTVGELNNISDLGIVSQLRGRDSTGIAVLKHRKKRAIYSRVMKAVDHSSNFLYTRDVIREMYDQSDKPFGIIGHCRAATQGDVNVENAHPFSIDHIVGVHNGTIANIRGKTKDGTDSEALYNILAEEGLQAAVDAARSGAYALVWVDQRAQTLNMIRNKERSLYYMVSAGVMYWASEAMMLSLIASRDNLRGDIKLLEVDTHLSLDLHFPISTHVKREVKPTWSMATQMVQKKVEEKKEAPKIESKTVVMGPVNNPLAWEKPKKTETGVPITQSPKYKSHVKYQAFRGKKMDLAKAQYLLKEGCAFCTQTITYHEERSAFFFNNKQYLCKDCAQNIDARENVNATKVYEGKLVIEGVDKHDCQGHC